MPCTSRRSGPAVVVKRAVEVLSGRSEFRIEVRLEVVAGPAASGLGSAEVEGTEIW